MSSPLTFTLPPEAVEEIAQRVAEIMLERQADHRGRNSGSRWATIDEAADYLRCSRQRVYDLRSSGRLSRHGDGGRALVDRRELDRLVEEAYDAADNCKRPGDADTPRARHEE